MNKLLNANLGGMPFAMDEDAYLRLKHYLDAIREKFRGTTYADEVVSDIEAHAAEQFRGHNGSGRVISLADVEKLIATLGDAEDVAGQEHTSTVGADKKSEQEQRSSSSAADEASGQTTRRLYRNPDDMMIAGVASGIAAYFGIDPLIVRIIFVIATFAGASGVLIYILLWLLVPLATTPTEKLEMRGDKVTLDKVEAMIKEKLKEANAEETFRRTSNAVQPVLRRMGAVLRDILLAIGGVLWFLLQFVFYVICIASILGMIALMAFIFSRIIS